MLVGRSCQGFQGPMALQELHHDDDHRYDKEEMEEAVERIGRDHPEKPSYHEDHHNGPQHGLLLAPSWAASKGRRLGGEAAKAPWAPVPPSVAFALSWSRA